jgi:hypothetical protein|eukprot:scaffold3156_cov268-Chaetoceros_neogracile.AAC.60
MNIILLALSSILLCVSCTFAWVSPIRGFSLPSSHLFQEKNDEKDPTEWGVSYIGGDPCGSKYNDDPFDATPTKPGFPDDMKARIEALAEQKRRESDEK